MTEKKKDVLRETDEEARALARKLVRAARYAAIAVIDAETGHPNASRVLTGTDIDGVPVILISALAPHMAALRADPRASLLFGEVGKGDPLAHARITLKCEAREIARDGEDHARIRRRFVTRHPKSKLYVDFPDFAFFRLEPVSASLNGGFGRAYAMTADDLVISSPASEALARIEESAVAHMNSDHKEAADLYARAYGKSKKEGWVIIGLDAAGIDLANGDEIMRIDLPEVISSGDGLRQALSDFLQRAREIT
ncbi:MAG: pyridoxamine 5'-phosphate oxidase [Rhizobiales bacterium]|nr:pyridoxamine 5'-phosphate oxidase [Hyphomicrobiales bacterium]MBA69280.1 pyridoxamine 5'-phosphate oxidase [Hyphomicrobiales bacterium]